MSYRIVKASAHQTGLPDKSVHMIATSSPYYGLRAYAGDQEVDWPEVVYAPMSGVPALVIPAQRCGLGAEETVEAFIGHLILVAREMWRVLRDDGTLWWNLGDSYNGSGGAGGDYGPGGSKEGQPKFPGRNVATLKPKDLMLIPARFALAAQADGWYVRSAMPWIKRNCLPESAEDRPGTVVESIYLLAKRGKYYFDMEAVKRPVAAATTNRDKYAYATDDTKFDKVNRETGVGNLRNGSYESSADGLRNFRSSDFFFQSWQGLLGDEDGDPLAMVVNPKSYTGSHFATWPLLMVETMIKAGTSSYGVCPTCQAPWKRRVEKTGERETHGPNHAADKARGRHGTNSVFATGKVSMFTTIGWRPTCACEAGQPIPATILDPFVGSGTTLKAAIALGRDAIGVDISEDYLGSLVERRVTGTQIQLLEAA